MARSYLKLSACLSDSARNAKFGTKPLMAEETSPPAAVDRGLPGPTGSYAMANAHRERLRLIC